MSLSSFHKRLAKAVIISGVLLVPSVASADGLFDQGKLVATGGVSQIEGAGGSGLSTWALITGYGSDRGVGVNAHHTTAVLSDFTLQATGFSVGLYDRVELSYTHHWFNTRDAGGRLGLGEGYVFDQDIIGAKIRLYGNAVYDQDKLLPQIAVGMTYKNNKEDALVRALGSADNDSFEYYLAATKILLDHSLIISATARLTEANQYGLLGFGSATSGHSLQGEFSLAYMITSNLVAGVDYRTKPDNLAFAREQNAAAAYLAYFFNKNISLTLAALDLGDIALQGRQRGAYLSLQAGF
ncbi:DUF3034 family protein [Paremcibacter congregatus]|uniref:DUF3034 domain-containing protein n=1 Tax=Paremcibacter congregatus TaxID=2043170 RepID=A0A2G4YVL3_9PROT|nr:DUF3034 family protein [Paremcibacter congregatus]PHZ86280.1 hypothetical protein CRD36_06335 [Paremcibacter congregatus]QDE27247.1 DUF3034 family protein [Paremcibacter congregatus]